MHELVEEQLANGWATLKGAFEQTSRERDGLRAELAQLKDQLSSAQAELAQLKPPSEPEAA